MACIFVQDMTLFRALSHIVLFCVAWPLHIGVVIEGEKVVRGRRPWIYLQ